MSAATRYAYRLYGRSWEVRINGHLYYVTASDERDAYRVAQNRAEFREIYGS